MCHYILLTSNCVSMKKDVGIHVFCSLIIPTVLGVCMLCSSKEYNNNRMLTLLSMDMPIDATNLQLMFVGNDLLN